MLQFIATTTRATKTPHVSAEENLVIKVLKNTFLLSKYEDLGGR